MKNLYPYITPNMEVVEIEAIPLLVISNGFGDVQSVSIDNDDDYDSDSDEILNYAPYLRYKPLKRSANLADGLKLFFSRI